MKNKYLSLLFLSILITCAIKAQVKTKTFMGGIPGNLISSKNNSIDEYSIKPPSNFNLLMEQAKNSDITGGIDNFAIPALVNINLLEHATQIEKDRVITYSLKLNAKTALNLSLHFDVFKLSKNSLLSIYTNYELTDSITSMENNFYNSWATRVYQGNILNISLKVPIEEKNEISIRIKTVYLGFKEYGITPFFGSPGSSADCQANVACSPNWQSERKSVALINAEGGWCTGSLIMNTCGTNIPYLLTAKHCVDAKPAVNNWVFQFLYYSTDCSTNTGYREDVQIYGGTLKASSGSSDFALLQLNQTPSANSGLYYAGWKRNNSGGNFDFNTTVLHHPKGDVMKISVDADPPQPEIFDNAQCWKLIFNSGSTQGGSSGGPIFNHQGRIIGQIFGVYTINADNPCHPDAYGGRFETSWTGGGTNSTRLSNWLDPGGTGAVVTNTTSLASLSTPLASSFIFINGADNFCTGNSSYSLNTIPGNTSISWTSSNTSVATITPTGNMVTLTMVNEGTTTITATITQCGTTIVRTKTVTTGFPYFYNPVNGADTAAPYGHYTFSQPLPYSYPTASYYWEVPSGWTILFGQGTSSIYVQAGGMGEGGAVDVDVTACGLTRLNHKYVEIGYSNCNGCIPDRPAPGGGKSDYTVKISPNPARSTAVVTLVPVSEKLKNTSYSIQQIKIADKMGSIKKQLSFNNRQLTQTINITGLPPDIYVVSVYDGHYWQNVKLIIQ